MFGFAEDTKDMTAAEILNYYRNRYYAEPQVTERGIVANAINDYFKESASKSEWISVDERLPTWKDGKVLIHTRHGISIAQKTTTNHWKGDNAIPKLITHWMPLPEPPKMKGCE